MHAAGRRAPELVHPRLTTQIAGSFANLTLPAADDVFVALGTTIKVAGSRAAFRAVDFDAVVAFASAARAAGCTRLGVVSAMGADSKSLFFYNRVKGDMEAAVSALGFATVVIARPSLLAGPRESLGQQARLSEKVALHALGSISRWVPANYRAIDADDVAHALIVAVQNGQSGIHVVPSGRLGEIARTNAF